MFAGIPIQLPDFRSNLKLTLVKVFCYAALVFKLFTMVFAMAYAYILFPEYSTILSYYAFSLSGDLTMLILVLKRYIIESSVQTISQLSKKLNLRVVGSKTIKQELLVFVLTGVVYTAGYARFFFYEQWDVYVETLRVPLGLSQDYIQSYTGTVLTCVFFYTTVNFINCVLTFMLLYNAYLSLNNIVDAFNAMVKREMYSDYSDAGSMKKYIVMYGEIFKCVKSVDRALNECCFFMLGTVVGSFFAAVSVTFSASDRYQTFGVKTFLSCTLVGCPIIFLVTTITGSRVTARYRDLRAILLEWSEKMEKYLSDPAVIRLFVLLTDNVRKSNLTVTGCRMFTINKGLILTVGGTIITYSFLLFQLDNGDPSEK